MSATSTLPSVAFFGATGGCVSNALIPALNAGYECAALVRTPQKLKEKLEGKVSEELQSKCLTIVQGNSHDVEAVKQTITKPDGSLRDIIISGIGGAPNFSNPLRPTLDDPHVCEKGVATITEVLKSNTSTQRPLLLTISTTGLTATRDIPLLMVPLYHWLLPIPHADKHKAEELTRAAKKAGLVRDYIVIRPSLFAGEVGSFDKLRAGYEGRKSSGKDDRWNKQDGIAMGYTITKDVVGKFIFEEAIAKTGKTEFEGHEVTLTL